ncbi:MAG: inorganic phosphate transporter [Armatimonadota bacterium]
MLDTTFILIGLVVLFALAFDFINGFHDTANAIATSVLTRALSMRNAVFLSAGMNFIGAMIWTGVAKTIGKGVVDPSLVTGHTGQLLVLAALTGAIFWNLLTWWLGLPSSSSHALIGGLIGAAIAARGVGVLSLSDPDGLPKIFKALIFSPIFGFLAGWLLMVIVMNIFARMQPSKLNRTFKVLQIISANLMAFTHGSNDAQKSMGIIAMALVVGGFQKIGVGGDISIPVWVKVACASSMAIGTAMGGWRIIKTVGKKIMGLQPVHGFAAETAAAAVVMTATHFGAPVSTTHVISSSIMGVGSAKRLSAVRWGIVGQILMAWLMTLPIAALLGALSYYGLHAIIR